MSVVPRLSLADLAAGGGLTLAADGRPRHPLAVVELGRATPAVVAAAAVAAARANAVLIGVGSPAPESWPVVDRLAVTLVPSSVADDRRCVGTDDPDSAVAAIGEVVGSAPLAALSLVRLLPLTASLPVPAGLVAESQAYSMLLAGPEFRAWRERTPRRAVADQDGEPVSVSLDGRVLRIALNRPRRHNAFGHDVRDGLVAALDVALADPSVQVELTGRGPSFCSGGDLDEFGTAPDVVTAHLIRLHRGPAAAVHACADRVRAVVHGACIGAGIEIPAFAGCLVARPDAYFQLPELRMGLIPGAGGTVGVTRRIGRWRTAYLALSGLPIDVPTALRWGLVDGRAD